MKLCGQLGEVGSPEDPFVLRATAGRRRKGHLKVAHYEVVGRVFTKATRPAKDDRLAACAREAVCEPRTEGSFVPSGRSYL
jgi:hypothetical protein